MMPLPTVLATSVPRKAPQKFITAAMASATGSQGSGGDRRGDRVRGVMEAVGEVEGQPHDDDQHHQSELHGRITFRSARGQEAEGPQAPSCVSIGRETR
jgi:hypothetical protein